MGFWFRGLNGPFHRVACEISSVEKKKIRMHESARISGKNRLISLASRPTEESIKKQLHIQKERGRGMEREGQREGEEGKERNTFDSSLGHYM